MFPEQLASQSPQNDNPRLVDCDHIFILCNDHSTRAKDVADQIERLQDIPRLDFGKKEYTALSTEQKPADTVAKVGERFKNNDGRTKGLIIAGGDATQSVGLDAALQFDIEPVGLFRGGNANNLPMMANQKRYASDMMRLIEFGAISLLRPVEITATSPDGTETVRRAFAHFGGGATAGISHGANEEAYRESVEGLSRSRRLIKEGRMAGRVVATQVPTTIEDENGQRSILDLTIMKGNRIAKGIYIGGLLLTDSRAAKIETPYPTHELRSGATTKLARVGLTIAKARFGRYTTLEMREPYVFAMSEEDSDSFKIHYDGEVEEYPSGTRFSVALHDKVVPVQTTRPRLAITT